MAKKSWDKKYQSIKKDYPNLDLDDLSSTISDDDIFIKMLGDILKSERKISSPGKRPSLNRKDGLENLNKMLDRDFSDLPFSRSFRSLCGNRSVRGIHAKTGLSKSHVQRLLTGQDEPSLETMEKIAIAFKKHPSYFLEYRISNVLEYFYEFLMKNSETATVWYRKIFN